MLLKMTWNLLLGIAWTLGTASVSGLLSAATIANADTEFRSGRGFRTVNVNLDIGLFGRFRHLVFAFWPMAG
jgi:hypothetical protein